MAIKCEIYRDSMQNYKKYAIPPAQLIIADVPYNVGNNFYGSNPMWYKGGPEKLIEIFTDPGDVVIDPCAGSGSTLRAAVELGRSGFEIDRTFYTRAKNEMLVFPEYTQIGIDDCLEGKVMA